MPREEETLKLANLARDGPLSANLARSRKRLRFLYSVAAIAGRQTQLTHHEGLNNPMRMTCFAAVTQRSELSSASAFGSRQLGSWPHQHSAALPVSSLPLSFVFDTFPLQCPDISLFSAYKGFQQFPITLICCYLQCYFPKAIAADFKVFRLSF